MKRRIHGSLMILAAGLALAASAARGNHITVTGVVLRDADTNAGATDVRFNLSWENSWRATWVETNTPEGSVTITNWDAAWVFVKYRPAGGNWTHALLEPTNHTVPAGISIDMGANDGTNNVGAFIYRSADGSGSLNLERVKLRWNYAAAGLAVTSQIDISVHAIEMVYIPQGNFSVGSGGAAMDETGSFTDGAWTSGTTFPFRITSETALLVTNAAGCLWGINTNLSATSTIGPPGVLSNAYPKGFNAFYCMKYEITQGQYTEFLNQLTAVQSTARFMGNTGSYRQTIGTNTLGIYTNAATDRAALYFNGYDLLAYADWAGLRPMTELEFEKACRGPKIPVGDEIASSLNYVDALNITITNFAGVDGSGTETAMPTNANALYYKDTVPYSIQGPVRAGIFAKSNSTRVASGAGYYGVMELSGNMTESAVMVGYKTGQTGGRGFMGTHGDGALTAAGTPNVPSWPNPGGIGFRGSYFLWYRGYMRVSDRQYASEPTNTRYEYTGGRAVRAAP